MKKMLRIGLLFLLLGLVYTSLALASAQRDEEAQPLAEYLPENTYAGFYQPQRVYKLNSSTGLWSPEKRATTAAYPCTSARLDLEQKGTWTGNLDDQGRCVGNAEAPQRATGNYLNYLQLRHDAARKNNQQN
jgi:hypothetical protein